jgi:hypothetical protein
MQSTKHIYNKLPNRPTWIGLFLLWAMLYNIVPLQLFHSHTHTETHCEATEDCHNTNPCHISLHHAHSGLEACSHTSHIAAQQDECDFCNYLSHHRQLNHIAPTLFTIGFNSQSAKTHTKNYHSNTLDFALSQANKGPPTVL